MSLITTLIKSFSSIKRKEIFLFFFILFIYLLTPRFLATDDGLPNRLLPISIIKEGNLYLDEYFAQGTRSIPYSIRYTNGHYVSAYPPGTAVLVTPFYILPALFNSLNSINAICTMARISASMISALAAVFIFIILKRFISEKWAIILTFLYAFATCQWSINAQDLWKTSATQFLIALLFLFLLRQYQTNLYYTLIGFCSGLLFTVRQFNAIFILLVGFFVVICYRKKVIYFILGAIIPLIFLIIYNKIYLGSFFDIGYGEGVINPLPIAWGNLPKSGVLESFFGLFFSPGRGMFIFSPVLIFSLLGIILLPKVKKELFDKNLRNFLLISLPWLLIYSIITSRWKWWWGGSVYGYRMVVDLVPFLILFFIPVVQSGLFKKTIIRYLFVSLFIVSIFIQFTGVIHWDESWFYKHNLLNIKDTRIFWSWKDSPILHYAHKFLVN